MCQWSILSGGSISPLGEIRRKADSHFKRVSTFRTSSQADIFNVSARSKTVASIGAGCRPY